MKNLMLKFTFLFLLFYSINSNAQVEEIKLSNPSFEDFARPAHGPRGWYDCGNINFPLETPPDVHPINTGNGKPVFGVVQLPDDGDSYLGMVIRETGSYESVAQRLESKLLIGNVYSFSLSLCTSETYTSYTRGNREVETDFTTPVFLRIWGGVGFCDKLELLEQSPLIYNHKWKEFVFFLEPKNEDISFIVLEVASDKLVNGNLLLDNASTIRMEDMESMDKGELSLLREQINKRNDSLGVVTKTQRLAKREITVKGTSIKFKNNQLTVSGERKIRSVVKAMQDLPNHKLIFDFNGIKKKKANPRAAAIVNILLEENFSKDIYEIRNSTEEDNNVKWLVDDDHMYIGILKIK